MKTWIALFSVGMLAAALLKRQGAPVSPVARPDPERRKIDVDIRQPPAPAERTPGPLRPERPREEPSTIRVETERFPHYQAYVAATVEVCERLREACEAMESRRFADAIRSCKRILRIDPHYPVARQLKDLAQAFQDGAVAELASADAMIEVWKSQCVWPSFPLRSHFRFPSAEEWADFHAREDGMSASLLDASIASLDVVNAPLTAVVDILQEKTGLSFNVAVPPDCAVVSFNADYMPLNALLQELLNPRGYGFAFHESAVWITTVPRAQEH